MTLTRSAGILAFYGILWHFGIFAKKSNNKSNPFFPILSDFIRFFSDFRLFPTFRLSDSTALVGEPDYPTLVHWYFSEMLFAFYLKLRVKKQIEIEI